MTEQLAAILVAFCYLHFKHFLCDFPLQTEFQYRGKEIYGHSGGILHAFIHAYATIPIFVLLRPSFGLALAIISCEFFLHYHIDWIKQRVLRIRNWNMENRSYWHTIGFDQMLHNFVYVGIIGVTIY